MFHVELAPLGGIFGPLKSDLGVFWPFRATDFIMGILKICDYLASTKKMGVFFDLGPLLGPCVPYFHMLISVSKA